MRESDPLLFKIQISIRGSSLELHLPPKGHPPTCLALYDIGECGSAVVEKTSFYYEATSVDSGGQCALAVESSTITDCEAAKSLLGSHTVESDSLLPS